MPTPEVAKQQEQSALNLAEADAKAAAWHSRTPGRIINGLPRRYDNTTPFYDRNTEQAQIQQFIQNGERLVTIHARAGAGKTALACKVLGDLEQRADLVTGTVALTAGELTRSISLDRILSDFGRLLPESTLSYQPSDPPSQKVAVLLQALQSGRYVLLLDNLESLLDETHHTLLDADLEALFTGVLQRGGLTIVVTTRHRPRLERLLRSQERPIPLDGGLPADEALLMLRGLDKDGRLPKEDAPLQNLIKQVDGFPRALEATVGWLADSPTRTLAELLQDTALFEGEVTQYIVEKALETLPPLFMRVMEVLALLAQPVTLAAVEYLLAPYVDWSAMKLRDVLDRLIERRFVSYNPANQRYSLHPLDRAYCEAQIPVGTSDDIPKPDAMSELMLKFGMKPPDKEPMDDTPPAYTGYALTARAAAFFRRQWQPKSDWKTLADLEPQLSEFEYRVRLGDYDTAARLLFTFDFDCLLLWGHVALMASLHERLLGKVKDTHLQSANLGNLGTAYRELGDIAKAIGYYEQALALDREVGDKRSEGANLGNLGTAYSDLGDIAKAIGYYEQALALAREVGNKDGEGTWLGNLGTAYSDLGDIAKAIGYYEQALALAREMGNKGGESTDLENLGEALAEQGDYARAFTCLKQSLQIAESIGSPRLQHFTGEDIARAHLYQGDLSAALRAIEAARQHDTPENNHTAAALHGVILLRIGDNPAAKIAFQAAISFADKLLTQSQVSYAVRYARALAQTGLALLDNSALDAAKSDYEAALTQCSARGVVRQNLRLLEQLTQVFGEERLSPLLALLRGYLS